MIETEEKSTEEVEDQAIDRGDAVDASVQGPDTVSASSSSSSKRLYCFSCHRMEYHFDSLKGKYYHHLLVGLTFGLILIFGPYRCRCCGHRRLVRFDSLNPRFHLHRKKYAGQSVTSISRPRPNREEPLNTLNMESGLQSVSEELERAESKDDESPDHGKQRKRKSKRLKSVPRIESIGAARKREQESPAAPSTTSDGVGFSIDGLISSFETEASRKVQAAKRRANESRTPLVARKVSSKAGAEPKRSSKRKRRRRSSTKKERLSGPTLHCFGCKQSNTHYNRLKGTTIYPFLLGISFGLISLVGPFRCSICSRQRFFGTNILHPKFHVRHIIERSGGDGYN